MAALNVYFEMGDAGSVMNELNPNVHCFFLDARGPVFERKRKLISDI